MAQFLEDRYMVIKRTDMLAALSADELRTLDRICGKVEHHRAVRGAEPLTCAVVEADWPEYAPTVKAILQRVRPAIREGQRWLTESGEAVTIRAPRSDSDLNPEAWAHLSNGWFVSRNTGTGHPPTPRNTLMRLLAEPDGAGVPGPQNTQIGEPK